MNEKGIQYCPAVESFWERRSNFISLNPRGTVPFLVAQPDVMIPDSRVIMDFLEQLYPDDKPLLPKDLLERAEVHKIIAWFDEKFFREVSEHILYERVFNFFKSNAEPEGELLKLARSNLIFHMKYLQFLLSRHSWVATDDMTMADLCVAAHISSLDYLGEINWNHYPIAKDWYAVMKSRPSFREILYDTITGFRPDSNYRELDF